MDDKHLARVDQLLTGMLRVCPRAAWSCYEACRSEGFTPEQALDLAQTFMLFTAQQCLNAEPRSPLNPHD